MPTAKKMVRTDGKTGYAIRLNLLPGIEIYTETAPTAFPLRLEFLDAHGGSVAAQMVYPRSQAVQMDGLWEPYSVYRHPSPVTVYGYPAGPVTHVTIFYHGFHHHHGH
ncbi:MAG: hypothetical protein NXI04_27180 [Planctomycetaceae bacterium]|nr:hypothetical protein [Planctomycetaceae bacterium]